MHFIYDRTAYRPLALFRLKDFTTFWMKFMKITKDKDPHLHDKWIFPDYYLRIKATDLW